MQHLLIKPQVCDTDWPCRHVCSTNQADKSQVGWRDLWQTLYQYT